jgi:hypothetical protein
VYLPGEPETDDLVLSDPGRDFANNLPASLPPVLRPLLDPARPWALSRSYGLVAPDHHRSRGIDSHGARAARPDIQSDNDRHGLGVWIRVSRRSAQ